MAKVKENPSATGKRKRAIARVRIQAGSGKITVNGKDFQEYFGNRVVLHKSIKLPLELTGSLDKFDIAVNVCGGGKVGQCEAVMYAISKALAEKAQTSRKTLKAAMLLTRDSRIKEMKKYGRKKARKRFQFSKR